MKTQMTLSVVASRLQSRPADAHKGTMGHALLVAGRRDVAGCAMLAAEACLRAGCGKLSVHSAPENRIPLHIAVPEAILLTEGLDCLLLYQSIGIGPGIGTENEHLLSDSLRRSAQPMVVDADALRILAMHPDWAEALRGRAILTPHGGEAQSLAEGFGLKDGTLVERMSQLAQQTGICIVAKGAPSIVCLPDGGMVECPRGNAGMATAGSGDVLTGLITGLLAQGYNCTDAAMLGVWLHATAGDFAAQDMGQECMLARDIIRKLPQAFAELRKE